MKSPAFLLYTGDFLSSPDVQLMEAHEVGAYCLLLFNSWQSDQPGYLPNDEDRIRRIARLSVEQWASSRHLLLTKFPVALANPARRYNPRLVAEASKQLQNRELKSRAGLASAQKRAATATGVAQTPTSVQHVLPENATLHQLRELLLTGVDNQATPVAAPPGTRCENDQQAGNLSLSISRLSSLRSESEAAEAASPAPSSKRRKSISSPSQQAGGRAAPPTLAEVQAYADTQPTGSAEATAFFDHFQSNGWRVGGKTPMVDWQAAFRGWLRRRPQFQAPGSHGQAAPPARARTAPKPTDPSRWS